MGAYQTSIRGMRLQLSELRIEDSQAPKIRLENWEVKSKEGWEEIARVMHHKDLAYISGII